MTHELPKKVMQKRATMDEPSDDRTKDMVCYCGQTSFYIGIKYATVKYAALLGIDPDGEPIYGDQTTRAPYATWICINGHLQTDGY